MGGVYLIWASGRWVIDGALALVRWAMSATTGRACAIYVRTATVNRPSEHSALDSQEARCRAKAARLGLGVGQVYRDEGQSGLRLERPGLDALRAAVARGAVSTVIVDDYARLARDSAAYARVASEWQQAGCTLIVAAAQP